MSVKIRLARVGRHKDPIYRIVVADSRSPRDGRYIEQIGTFDASKQQPVVKIDEQLALKWLNNGAQPSDTIKTLFTSEGIVRKWTEAKAAAKKQGK